MRALALIAALAAAALSTAPWSAAAEPVKIRASWVVAPSDWTPLLPEKPELMKNNGKTYAFEALRFQGTPSVITALANNEIELGNLAFSSLALAIQNAGLEDLRIVGDQFKDGMSGHYSNEFFVLATVPSARSMISKAGSSRPTPPEARSTSPCGRCCASTGSRTNATIPWSRRRSPP